MHARAFRRALVVAALSGTVLLGVPPASAENPPDRTGTGGGPDSTLTAPNTNALGVTKSPGSELGPETPAERRELERVRRENDRIDEGICVGCGAR